MPLYIEILDELRRDGFFAELSIALDLLCTTVEGLLKKEIVHLAVKVEVIVV